MNDMKSRGSRKVAVLGPIPRDQVVTYAGERVEKYGCVMYTAVALSALLEAGTRRIHHASVLLDPLTGISHHLVARDRPQHRNLTTPPAFYVIHSRTPPALDLHRQLDPFKYLVFAEPPGA